MACLTSIFSGVQLQNCETHRTHFTVTQDAAVYTPEAKTMRHQCMSKCAQDPKCVSAATMSTCNPCDFSRHCALFTTIPNVNEDGNWVVAKGEERHVQYIASVASYRENS